MDAGDWPRHTSLVSAICLCSDSLSGQPSERTKGIFRIGRKLAFWTLCGGYRFSSVCSWVALRTDEPPRPLLQWTFGLPAVLYWLGVTPGSLISGALALSMMALAFLIALAGIVAWSRGWCGLTVPYMVGNRGIGGGMVVLHHASQSACRLVWQSQLWHLPRPSIGQRHRFFGGPRARTAAKPVWQSLSRCCRLHLQALA